MHVRRRRGRSQGAPKPDSSAPEAFRRAVLAAKSISCPDPALGGSSGVHIANVFERLGISEAVKPKLIFVRTPEQAHAMPSHLVAEGKAEMGLHQMQELMAVPGIEIVGPLPGNLQGTFVFSAAIMTAADADAVNAGENAHRLHPYAASSCRYQGERDGVDYSMTGVRNTVPD